MHLGRRWKRLRTRLVAWTALPAVLLLAVVAVLTFLAYQRVVEQDIVERERERVSLAANRMKEELDKYADELLALAQIEARYQGYPLGQVAALRDTGRRLAVFDGGVILLDHLGHVMGTEPQREGTLGEDWSDRSYFSALIRGEAVVFSDAVPDGPDGGLVVGVAVPVNSVYSQHQRQLGALVGMFRLGEPTISAFYASVVRLRMGDGVYLVDGKGRVIYHPDPARIGEDLSGDAVVGHVLAGQVGALHVPDRGADAGDVVVGYAPVPGTSWGLITEKEWSTVASASRSYGRVLLALLVLGIIMPSIGFGLLAYVRRGEAVERAQIEQQMRVARLVQQTQLPGQAPDLSGWQLKDHYEPAQAVGGDFYDFLPLEDGRLGLVIGDVTDKGVPAALVMATTRALLRTVAEREGGAGGPGDGDDARPVAHRRRARAVARARPGQGQRASAGRDPAQDVCDVPVCRPRSGHGTAVLRERRPQSALSRPSGQRRCP
jgi:hypothetical protein